MFESRDPRARRLQLSLRGLDFFLAVCITVVIAAAAAAATPIAHVAPFRFPLLLRSVVFLGAPLQTVGHADTE